MKLKPIEKRLAEALEIRKQMDGLGLGPADDDDVAKLCAAINEFVRGRGGFFGKIPIPAIGRVALVKLSVQDHVESSIVLRRVT